MNRKARRAAQSGGGRVNQQLSTADTLRVSAAMSAAKEVNRGDRNRETGKLSEALDCYIRAIDLVPDYMDAHINICTVLIALERFADAAKLAEQILGHNPRLVAAHIVLGVARIRQNDFLGALNAARNALKLSETQEARMLFANCLQYMQSIPEADDQTAAWIARAIVEPWGRPSEYARHGVNIVSKDPDIGACIERAVSAWPHHLPAADVFGANGLQALSRHKLLRALLENTRIADIALERLFTTVRFDLLQSVAAQSDIGGDVLEFYCSLARQCFINEYVYALSDSEQQKVEALRAAASAALSDGAAISAIQLVALATYIPLHTLDNCEKLLSRRWPADVDALLTQQVREPAEEIRLQASIPTLTIVEDDVSLLVQQQYEQNPYPRWVKVAPSSMPSEINAQLHRQFPHSQFQKIGKNGAVDLLVAGCGTGQQLIDVTMRFTNARITAIDLSLPSLCYAKRKTDELGLRGIEYGRADILKLKELGRTFDVIDSAGVLHHLADPIVGWNVLLSLLRPNGVMRIALYSEIARRHVVAARNFVAEHGYSSSAGDIRRFRQDVLALPEDHTVRLVAKSSDFFSISDCRDLVFHVQEHRFTLQHIKIFLAASGLNFIGFDIHQDILNRYRNQFPDDWAAIDFDRWHAFEMANPWTFGGMYQFWLQKRG